MVGKMPLQKTTNQFNDPFSVGQLVGMLVMITFIEKNGGTIPKQYVDKLKLTCADKASDFLQSPSEDIFLMVDRLVEEIKKIQ